MVFADILPAGRTAVMGVLNVTPDSFFDGEAYLETGAAVRRGVEMVEEGADLIDVGGESTRPGAAEVPEEEELRRVLPVVEALAARTRVPISVDTRKARVAEAAVRVGAAVVNDVSGLTFDPAMARTVAALGVPVIVMHTRGTPATMQQMASYADVVVESAAELADRVRRGVASGIDSGRIAIDPGFGFAKTADHNLELLARLGEWAERVRRLAGAAQLPLVVGTSRKSFIGQVLGDLPPLERKEGTAATVALAVAGGANVVRVHDVQAMVRVARMTDAVMRRPPGRARDQAQAASERHAPGTVRIELSGMSFSARHGVYEEERSGPRQPFVVDVEMELARPPGGDDLAETVDYSQVYRWVKEVVDGPNARLIETLALRVADTLEQRAGDALASLRVRVHKPAAPLGGPVHDVMTTVDRRLRKVPG